MISYIFTLVLALITLITGILWFINLFKNIRKRRFNKNIEKTSNKDLSNNINAHTVPSPLPNWMTSLASFFPIVATIFMVRSFAYEPFNIPSDSMSPSIIGGDLIIVNKFTYGIRNPFTHKIWFSTSLPKRGDIAVFQYPRNKNMNYIKRIIGIPGDKVIYNSHTKELVVYKNCDDKKTCSAVPIVYNTLQIGNSIAPYIADIIYDKSNRLDLTSIVLKEERINDVIHNIFLMNNAKNNANSYYKQPKSPQCTWIVHKGQYFVMGDNRDNSFDSRYWGFVSEQDLIGKAIMIWMSIGKSESNWPIHFRFTRIGFIK